MTIVFVTTITSHLKKNVMEDMKRIREVSVMGYITI